MGDDDYQYSDRLRRLPEPISVEEALGEASGGIKVPDGQELTVGPLHKHAADFRIAEVRSFHDMQRMGFIPEQVTEDAVIQAVRKDDRLHREALRHHGVKTCSCESGAAPSQPMVRRRHYQDHLIEVLQPLYRQALSADDTAVVHPFRYADKWLSRGNKYLVGLFSLEDIDIGRSATLVMTASVTAVYARNVTIGSAGRFRLNGGNVLVKCKTLNGPSRFGDSIGSVVKSLSGLTRDLLEASQ